jgi:hypothetical protein
MLCNVPQVLNESKIDSINLRDVLVKNQLMGKVHLAQTLKFTIFLHPRHTYITSPA